MADGEINPLVHDRTTMSVLNTEAPEVGVPRRLEIKAHLSVPQTQNVPVRILLNEDAFVSMLYLERRRTERTQKRFVLVLIDVGQLLAGEHRPRIVHKLASGISEVTRETDVIGWYVESSVVGIIGTELGSIAPKIIQDRFLEKLRALFKDQFENAAGISISFYFFPQEPGGDGTDHTPNVALYPEVARRQEHRRFAFGIKRLMDIVGSAVALLLLAPLFALIAIAIKLSSHGPVLFRQERLGQYGRGFMLLKFRSMRTNCDSKIHEAYVNQFIANQVDGNAGENSKKPVFKIQGDPRVTKIGRFLRKTSLDELPQFWNVLMGDMSLVGPRPAVTYEYRAYRVWHRRRVVEIKPGITGLWQVKGRSRTRFDDMVRLDLKYARGWSIWLDLKILAQTPAAVLTGDGAH